MLFEIFLLLVATGGGTSEMFSSLEENQNVFGKQPPTTKQVRRPEPTGVLGGGSRSDADIHWGPGDTYRGFRRSDRSGVWIRYPKAAPKQPFHSPKHPKRVKITALLRAFSFIFKKQSKFRYI